MSPLRRFLEPPVFEDEDRARSARMFHTIALSTAAIVTLVFPLIPLVQPDTLSRVLQVFVSVNFVVMLTLFLNKRGHTHLACGLYLTLVFTLIVNGALTAGGIRSPGVQSLFVFVMLAGLVLGDRAGAITAAAAALLSFGLALTEHLGMLPAQEVTYTALVRWMLTCVYLTVVLFTMRLGTGAIREALSQAQRELAERRTAERRLSQALEAGAIGVFEHDLRSGEFRGDERTLAHAGLDAKDGAVPFDTWQRMVHPEDRDKLASDLREFEDGQYRGHTSYRIRRPDGAERHLETAAYLTPDEHGKPATIVGMIVDVTDRKRAEHERERLVHNLGERMKELRLLHNAAQLLQRRRELDRDLLEEFVTVMPTAWQYPDDCVARIFYQDVEASSPRWQTTPWTQSASFTTSSGLGLLEVAYLHQHPPADEGPFLAEERALIDSLAQMLRAHIEEQIAEKQRLGLETQLRQSQKMEALGTLAGGIAHDFNNILMAIGANTELALAELAPGTSARESIEEIANAHNRARDLVKRILLFSRQQKSARQATPLALVVDEALKLVRASVPVNIEIKTSMAPGLPLVLADTTQIHQIVLNLVTNAAYAMSSGGGVLTVELDAITFAAGDAPSADLGAGRHVRLTVRDTGTGMSDTVRERLFEPFFTTKGHAGTGLGLSVVHGIVRDHGGAVTVESELGKGTAFRIYFPATAAEAGNVAAEEHVVIAGTGEHIMCVDDDERLILVMSRLLERLGYRCTAFTSGDAALQDFRVNSERYAAVITDLQMPAMSGLELARALRAVRGDIPVAIASGRGGEDGDPTFCWLPKPSTVEELSRTMHQMLRPRPVETA